MRNILEIVLAWVTSSLIGIYILLYVMHENELFRFLFGELLIASLIFVFIMWLFGIAKTREKRRRKIEQRKRERRIADEKISQGTERA